MQTINIYIYIFYLKHLLIFSLPPFVQEAFIKIILYSWHNIEAGLHYWKAKILIQKWCTNKANVTWFLNKGPCQRARTVVAVLSRQTWIERVGSTRVIPYKLQVPFLRSHMVLHLQFTTYFIVSIFVLKKQMFSVPLLDKFWLNQAKQILPLISLFTSEPGSWGMSSSLRVCYIFEGCSIPTIWHTEHVLKEWQVVNECF